MLSLVGQKVSHFQITAKLGEGGMGVVYKARDEKLDRDVALKFLPHELISSAEDHARFLQEARAASALNHPNICAIHALGEHEGLEFIDMEYIEGKTLRKQIPVEKLEDAISFAIQIAEALQEAHSKGIVHRDIKTDNIMVTAKNQIKVLDFGLAKLRGSLKLTKPSSTVGTLAYMAPEQIQGGEADMRSDIFSFGAVMFEMLTGHTPFRGDHEAAMMYSILHEEPESVQKNRQDIPQEINRIIHRALEKDPEDRYQHADDMVSELRRVQKQSTRVSRTPLGEGTGRPSGGKTSETPGIDHALPGARPADQSQKRSRQFILLGIIVVVLLAGFIGYVWFFGRHQSIDSIAVLPFENVGADPNTEYLSDGITESLINALSQLSNLSVRSGTSVFHYKGKNIDPLKAGKELGVNAVLVGRVTQWGDNLKISTELVDIENANHIWGGQYNKRLSDILAVQDEISKSISQQLSLKLASTDQTKLTKRSTENTEAYQLYLKGRFYWNKRGADNLQKAVDYFNQAIEKDSGYALAYAGLASTYDLFPEYAGLPAKDFIPKAETAAKKALELDATLAEPHAVLGSIKFQFQWDWEGAEREFKRAIELNPNYPTTHQWYSDPLREQGRLDEALSEIRHAQELDPLSLIVNTNVGEILYYMHRDNLAIEQLKKTLELDPNFSFARGDLGLVFAQQSRFDEAISELQKVRQLAGQNDIYGSGELGYVYAKAGKKDEAIKLLNELLEFSKEGKTVSVEIAWVYAGLGIKDKAFEWLEKGYIEQNMQLGYLKVDPMWDNLRSDSRYAAMLRKIGLDR